MSASIESYLVKGVTQGHGWHYCTYCKHGTSSYCSGTVGAARASPHLFEGKQRKGVRACTKTWHFVQTRHTYVFIAVSPLSLRSLSPRFDTLNPTAQLSQRIIEEDGPATTLRGRGGLQTGRAGWIEQGPQAITGPSKVFVKGLCRYRSRADREEGAEAPPLAR